MTATAQQPPTPTQQTIDTVTRTVDTPLGFRLRVPIPLVHLGETRRPEGTHHAVIWRHAEQLLQAGYGVVIPTRHRGHLRVEFYGRIITKRMVAALARLKRFHDRHPEVEWAERGDYGRPNDGDWARLRFWGLIEPRPSEGTITWRGWWRLTGLGHQWLRGREFVPRQVAVVDGVCVGYVNALDRISVHDVDDEFSLDAVRAASDPAPVGAA